MIRKEKFCLLIDTAISDDSSFNTNETEKLSKYENLGNAVSRMWEFRTNIVPVIIGTLGIIKNGLDQKLQLLPGQPSTIELPKFTLISTAHSIRKVLG